jgi:hypothetical protein
MSKKYLVKWTRIYEVSVIVDNADSQEEAMSLGVAAAESSLNIYHAESTDFEASVIEDTDPKKS